jgi:hypothetical protein
LDAWQALRGAVRADLAAHVPPAMIARGPVVALGSRLFSMSVPFAAVGILALVGAMPRP